MAEPPLITPDGRYIVVRGRLWRRRNPALADERATALIHDLMDARRAVAAARRDADADAEARAHRAVQTAKLALGERGSPWWTDNAPDYTRHLARNTPYADWFADQMGESIGR